MLYDLRNEIVAVLAGAGIKAYPEGPQSFSAPGAIVEYGSPFAGPGESYNSLRFRYDVSLMVNASPKGKQEAEGLIGKALVALTASNFAVETVQAGEVFINTANDRTMFGAVITISADVLTEELNN